MINSVKWKEIYLQLNTADERGVLNPHELETFALAAYLIGKDAYGFQIFERAYQGYLNSNETQKAIRCTFWLGLMFSSIGESAKGGGWFAKGKRLLEEEQLPDCSEKGLFLVPEGLGALYSGKAILSKKIFQEATTIGEKFSDIDLVALGRLGQGQAMIELGEVDTGLKLLDETMIAVETEGIFPIATGIIYCAVIETCRKVWDIRRAQAWTKALTYWCDQQPDIVPFKGQCLVRRAEIMQFHGEFSKALNECSDACELLTQPPGEPAAGEAFYRKAELHRILGDYEKAEDCYREAGKWGRNPQPGLALLRISQSQFDAAETSLKNILKETTAPKSRANLLPAMIRVLIDINQFEEAWNFAEELCMIAKEFDVPYLVAISNHCKGSVLEVEGKQHQALKCFQRALQIWNSLSLPYEAAQTRELKGLVYRDLNDKDNSNAELNAAFWVFEQLKAKPDMERIKQYLEEKQFKDNFGLSLREVQVLQLLISGKTNKSIADELFISERTVDRHVSNIFNKFNVSSRVEATTFALRNKIFDPDTF